MLFRHGLHVTNTKNMTEFEKMRSERLYDFSDAEILASLAHAKEVCARLQMLTIDSREYRELIQELIPGIPDDSTVCPPFHCDHGNGIRMGHHVFINYNCVVLDGATVTFEDYVKVGPACQFYTPQHPMDYGARRKPQETSYPIVIGEDSWLGGGVVVLPGVKIGKRCIIGAGSVVVHDIPDDSLAVGNPCEVKRSLLE